MEALPEVMEIDQHEYRHQHETISHDASDSDSDADPNDAPRRPRRQAGIRARSVIASACGVKNRDRVLLQVKKEDEEKVDMGKVDSFVKGTESEVQHIAKTEAKPVIVKKDEEEFNPRLTRAEDILPSSNFDSELVPSPFAPSPPPPAQTRQKRQREVLECVLLPRRTDLVKRQRVDAPTNDNSESSTHVIDLVNLEAAEDLDDDDTVKAKMMKWKNKKVKKNENLCLLPETLRDRIKPIGLDVRDDYITVDPLTRDHMVTRRFMSEAYGGSSQATGPTIGPLHAINHPYRNFFYINTDFQPEAPEVPGAPGLWLSTGPGDDMGIWRTITKIKSSKQDDNKWLYVGQYDIRAANPPALTVAEWRAQPSVFHNTWANAIVKSAWGIDVLIRIHARKIYGRNPTKAEYDQMEEDRSYSVITEEEVKEAYLSGQERMGVWTAKCVGYDNDFQTELSAKFTPDWRPRTPEERKAWIAEQKRKLKLKKEAERKEMKLRLKKETKVKVKKETKVKVKKEAKGKVKKELKQAAKEEQGVKAMST